MKEPSMTTKGIASAKSGKQKTSVDRKRPFPPVDRKALAIILAFAVLGGTLALAQGSKPQATNGANVHAKSLDRCPYYPSPVFCRSVSGSREQDETGHNADGR
jgi:hypothetical protein